MTGDDRTRETEALLARLMREAGDPDLAAEALAETLAAALLEGDDRPARPGGLAGRPGGLADAVLAALRVDGTVPDGARRRLRLAPLVLAPAARTRLGALPAAPPPESAVLVERPGARATDDLVGDLLAELDRAAARRARSRGRAPRRALAGAVAVLAVLAAGLLARDGEPPDRARDPAPAEVAGGAVPGGGSLPRAPASGCAPGTALLEALPALRAAPADVPLPAARVAAAARTTVEVAARWARRWAGGADATWWVVPRPRCAGGLPSGVEEACLVRVPAAGAARRVVCAGPRRLRGAGARAVLRLPGRVVFAGFAPAGAYEARVAAAGRGARTFAVVESVFVAVAPRGARDRLRLTFR